MKITNYLFNGILFDLKEDILQTSGYSKQTIFNKLKSKEIVVVNDNEAINKLTPIKFPEDKINHKTDYTYFVDNKGEVYSVNRHNEYKHLKQSNVHANKRLTDYLQVGTAHGTYHVHKLMAYAFLGQPEGDKIEIDHIDNDPSNNVISNLRWISKIDNLNRRDRTKIGRKGKSITQYTIDGEKIRTYNSVKEAAEAVGGYKSNISACARGQLKTANHYIWKYNG